MLCLICQNLEAALAARREEFIEAGTSACDQISSRFVAYRNVEMERARAELMEHRLVCLAAANEDLHAAPAGLAGRAQQDEMKHGRVGAAA